MERRSVIFLIGWISLLLWLATSSLLAFLGLVEAFWAVVYLMAIVYIGILVVAAFIKFRASRYFQTSEGKLFGSVSAALLFVFLCQLCWVILNTFTDGLVPELIYGFTPSALFYSIFINLTRCLVYLFGIFVVVKAARAHDIKLTFRRQLTYILIASGLLMVADRFVVHPFINDLLEGITVGQFARNLIDSFPPVMNILLLLVSLWLFITLIANKAARVTATLVLITGLISVVDLVSVAVLHKGYYFGQMSFITGLGYAIIFIILGQTAIKYHATKRIEIMKTELDRINLAILGYIRNHPGCIKKDITSNFQITRMTTNMKLSALEKAGLISVRKSGREKLLRLSDSGLVFVKSI